MQIWKYLPLFVPRNFLVSTKMETCHFLIEWSQNGNLWFLMCKHYCRVFVASKFVWRLINCTNQVVGVEERRVGARAEYRCGSLFGCDFKICMGRIPQILQIIQEEGRRSGNWVCPWLLWLVAMVTIRSNHSNQNNIPMVWLTRIILFNQKINEIRPFAWLLRFLKILKISFL